MLYWKSVRLLEAGRIRADLVPAPSGKFSYQFARETLASPNIDRLARQGTRFRQFYVSLADLLALAGGLHHRVFFRTLADQRLPAQPRRLQGALMRRLARSAGPCCAHEGLKRGSETARKAVVLGACFQDNPKRPPAPPRGNRGPEKTVFRQFAYLRRRTPNRPSSPPRTNASEVGSGTCV